MTQNTPTSPPSELRLRRHAAGLSLEELAAAAGVSVSTIHRLEVGQRYRPYKSTKAAIANALGLNVADVFPGTTEARRMPIPAGS